ncbi:hypothetical protein [Candidatus Neptunichlamydia sp. REUL1]|uniref:hypothetical protein n=1 Tax=Candidatus Neptunichlamydia sp. REUL1 TaxID=3064277 RepID=UPI00292DC4A2|nr:hypothetical protein [Candidatus Neptunochlamydia sp. REUL1]
MSASLPSVSTKKPQIQSLEQSYLQYGYLSPESIPDRIQANTVHISYLKGKVTAEIRGSSLFQLGYQEINEYFQRLFKTLSARLKGEQPVINAASSELVTQFGTCHSRYHANHIGSLYEDIYETTAGRVIIDRIPSRQLVDQLRALLKGNFQWIQEQFAQVLRGEGRMIVENIDLDSRDSSYLQYSFLKPFSMLFPKRSDTLKTIYASLLEIEWLEHDQKQLTGYLEKRGSLVTKSLTPKQPSKYDELFESQDRFSSAPHGRLKANLRCRLHLQGQVSDSFHHTSLFQVGKQEDNAHFQELFKSFFAQARGAEPLVKAAAAILINRFGYPDVCEVYKEELSEPIYRSEFGEYGSRVYTQTHTTHRIPRERVLEELHHLIEKSYGLKRRFLEALRQEGRMLTEGLKVTDRDYSGLRAPNHLVLHYPVKFYGHLFSRCQEKLEDIFTKLLVTAWLEEDSKQLSIYLGLTQPVSEEIPDLPLAFIYNGQAYGIRKTKPDGTCALHALLGKAPDGEYCYQGDIDVREVFIEKIKAKKTELSIQELLHDILIGHLNAEGDPSSQMLFKGLAGQRLKQAHHDLSKGFKGRLASSKQTEAELWIQELGVLRGKLLHEARKSSRYDGMTDLEIIEALQENTTYLLDIIIPEKRAFLALIHREKQERVQEEHNKQDLLLNQWYQAEKAFILTEVYPHYLTLLANPDFYLNTQEITLAAFLFNKKAQVLNSQGTATEVIHRELEAEPILIYHEGCHFSRCTPCSREETTRLKDPQDVLKSHERRQDAQGYVEAKSLAEHQRRKDQFALQTLNLSLKEEASQLIVSGGLSAMASNPIPLLMQLSRTLINSSGSYIDPLNESGEVQFLKLLGNSGFVRLLGGNMLQIGTSLTVDLVSLATRPKELSRGESTIRSFGMAALKGIGTLDEKKFVEQILGALVSEASQTIIPEAQKSDIWEERLVRALFTNADIQGAFVDHMVEGMLKKESKPKVSESLDPEQAKYPKRVLPEVDELTGQEVLVILEGVDPGDTAIVAPRVIQMQDPEAYVRLQKEKELEVAKLPSLEKTAEADKKQYDKDHKDKVKYKGKKDDSKSPYGLIKYGNLHKKAREACAISKPKAEKSAQKLTDQKNTIADIDRKITEASAPKQINAPDTHIHRVFKESTKKNHHVYIVDSRGDKHSLGKYSTAEDARFISGVFTRGEANKANYNIQCYDIQQQMLTTGVPIGQIPNTPEFKTPSFSGNDVDKNHSSAQQTSFFNREVFQDFVKDSEQIMGRSIEVQGLSRAEIHQISSQAAPNIKEIPQDSLWDKTVKAPGKAYDATSKFLGKIGFSTQGGVNLVTVSSPETASASGQPTFFHHDLKPASTSKPPSSYFETRHQIAIEESRIHGRDSASLSSSTQPLGSKVSQSPQWDWPDTQAHQTRQIFEMNMAYQSPSQSTSAPLDYSWMVPEGLASNYQLPSTDLSSLGRNSSPSMSPQVPQGPLQLAGLVPCIPGGAQSDPVQKLLVNDFTKSVPKGPMKIATAIMSLMLPDMSDIKGAECPKAHFKRVANHVFQKYDQIVEIQNPNSFGAQAGEFVGEMIALGGIGKVIRVAEGISIFGMACEGGFIGAVVAEAHDTNKVAGVAFGFIGGAGTGKAIKLLFRTHAPTPLIDRALTIKPEAFSQEIRAIEAMQQPFYRSGFVSEKAAMKLAERNVSKIRTDWVFPKKGGAMINGRWYTEHALERMAPRTPEVMAELEVRALNRAAAEGIKPQTKEFKDFWLKHRPDPRNIPPSVVEAEIANPGSTSIRVELNDRGDIITVMPGGKR